MTGWVQGGQPSKPKWANNDETYVVELGSPPCLHTPSFIVVSPLLRFYGPDIVEVAETVFTTLRVI